VAEGARRMLAAAVEAEVEGYITAFAGKVDEVRRRLVRRTDTGTRPLMDPPAVARRLGVNRRRVDVEAGERCRFKSGIVPPWCRKSPR